MRKLIKLQKDLSICYSSTIVDFLNPDQVYIPKKDNYELLVKQNENVLKGQIILENNLNKVISPISGIVKGLINKNVDGKIQKTVVIQNDFKEKEKSNNRKIKKYNKEIIISKLYEYYFKYIASILESKKINHLIIKGLDDEPYIVNNSYVLNSYHREILELADLLTTQFNIANTLIVIKSNDTSNIEKYLANIGTYPNIHIKLIEDYYLIGNDYFLLENLTLSERDTLVIDAKTFLEMYYALFYNKYFHETFITISGKSIEKAYVIKAKTGSLLSDVITKFIKYKDEKHIYILNGLMTGTKCDPQKTIITKNTKGVIIIPDEEIPSTKCISCGLCYKICPVKVNPKKVMDSHKISNNCLDCGLCSYICPSYINLRKYLRGEYE